MVFDASNYGRAVQEILAVDGDGLRPMPLAAGRTVQKGVEALRGLPASKLFAGAYAPEAALGGLYLYFCAYEESHKISQDIGSAEGSFWHGILHRQEPDPGNAGYWFRRVGQHSVFPVLRDQAASIVEQHPGAQFHVAAKWDPFAFIEYCEKARRMPESIDEETAMAIQLVEWQLLFDYCARPVR